MSSKNPTSKVVHERVMYTHEVQEDVRNAPCMYGVEMQGTVLEYTPFFSKAKLAFDKAGRGSTMYRQEGVRRSIMYRKELK